jgi:hypothetical protein
MTFAVMALARVQGWESGTASTARERDQICGLVFLSSSLWVESLCCGVPSTIIIDCGRQFELQFRLKQPFPSVHVSLASQTFPCEGLARETCMLSHFFLLAMLYSVDNDAQISSKFAF